MCSMRAFLTSRFVLKACLVLAATVFCVSAAMLVKRSNEPAWKGRPIRDWMRDLHHEDVIRRDAAESALLNLGASAVPSLSADLQARDTPFKKGASHLRRWLPAPIRTWIPLWKPASQIRAQSASVLRKMGPDASPAIPQLIETLKDPETSVSNLAEYALVQIGAPSVIPLAQAAQADPGLALPALRILSEIGANEAYPVKVAAQFTQSADEEVQHAAALAHWSMCGDADLAVEVFSRLLSSPDSALRTKSAQSLGRIGPSAWKAAPELEDTMQASDTLLRMAAAESLFRINGNQSISVQVFRQALKDPSVNIRWKASKALGRISAGAAPAVPDLILALTEDPEKVVRIAAAQALGRIGPPARTAIDPLRAAERDPDALVRSTAAQSLWRIAPDLFTSNVSE